MQTDRAAEEAALSDVFGSDRESTGTAAPVADSQSPTRDDQGRFSADKAALTPPATPAIPPPVSAPDTSHTGHQVPISELMTEREKRKQEARLREEADANVRKYRDLAESYERRIMAAQQQRQAPQAPDPYTEPGEALHHQAQQLRQEFHQTRLNDRANMSERDAVKAHGATLVTEARDAALRAGVAQHFFQNSPDPYDDVVAWHKEQKFRTEVGADPDAYKKRVMDEAKAKVLEELKAGTANGQPARFPGSLADATSAGQQGGHLSDQTAISGVFASDRRGRAR